ncbi:MAG: ATP-dependent helicase [Rhizobacter sp.]|nr:ATP-dependent helicase [Chlorobiales bacterium]
MSQKFYVIKDDNDSAATHPAVSLEKYQSELNASQLDAVTTTRGALLVVAGAGTGKTKTLTYRAGYLIESGIAAADILLLTFTRRAAREMLARASTLCDVRAAAIEGGTFHSYAHRMLRQYSNRLGFERGFTILDQSDSEDIIDLVRTSLNFHKKEKRFPKKSTLQNIISSGANKQLVVNDVVALSYPHFAHFTEEILLLATAYRDYKQTNALLDYDDLLTEFKRLLTSHTDIHEKISASIRHLMVDEYQDTNLVQDDLVRLLCKVHGNVMAVGDDAQSIYSFRGANFRNILDFPKKFADCKVIKLEENYRSTERILSLTNFVINQATEKFTKHLFTRTKPGGEFPAIVAAPDERFQSKFIAQMVLELREEGVGLDKMAVLMRSSRNSFELELELAKRKIPFVKYGGQKFTEAAHIKDVLAHLKIILNPKDVIAWNRALLLLEGIGPKTAQDFTTWVKQAQNPYNIEASDVSPKYIAATRGLAELLKSLSAGKEPAAKLIEKVVQYYLPLLRAKYFEDYPKREKDLENFIAIAQNHPSLEDLLAELALEPVDFSAVGTERSVDDEAPLVLSTIHSAKGLEWHSVFLLDALDGVIPSSYAVGDAAELDEELRLLYVALTRAKERLYISYPILSYQRAIQDYLTNPSRFIANVPPDLFERITLIDARQMPPPLPQSASQLSSPPKQLGHSDNSPSGGSDDLPF